jgi:DNA polymerase-3 subunit gamma/tau
MNDVRQRHEEARRRNQTDAWRDNARQGWGSTSASPQPPATPEPQARGAGAPPATPPRTTPSSSSQNNSSLSDMLAALRRQREAAEKTEEAAAVSPKEKPDAPFDEAEYDFDAPMDPPGAAAAAATAAAAAQRPSTSEAASRPAATQVDVDEPAATKRPNRPFSAPFHRWYPSAGEAASDAKTEAAPPPPPTAAKPAGPPVRSAMSARARPETKKATSGAKVDFQPAPVAAPVRATMSPRVTPSPKAAAAGGELGEVTVDSDKAITAMDEHDARALVKVLEQKLRVARQTILRQTLKMK